MQVVSDQSYSRPQQQSQYQAPNYNVGNYGNQRPGSFSGPSRHGKIYHNDDAHNADVIHSRLLDLLDPSKHMHAHPGIPYDFYSGYILMVANNVDTDDNDVDTSSYSSYRGSSSSQTPATTHLYGILPNDVITELQRNYGRFYKVCTKLNLFQSF